MIRVLLCLVLLAPLPARAALTEAELDRVAAEPQAGARLDLGLGRPTVLIFADVDCGALCDAVLGQTATALAETGLPPEAYALVVVGLDPRDEAAAARDFVKHQAAPLDPAHVEVRRPDPDALAAMMRALGYRYAYDAPEDRFAHAAARYVLTASGEVTRVLPAFRADPGALRLALVEAAEGRVGTFAERLVLLCYGFDPVTGRYTMPVLRTAMILSILTALILFGGIGAALLRERRATR